jgi:hypothetical protein
MNKENLKMTRSLLRFPTIAATAAATLLCVAAPAFAQESPPPTAASVPPPMRAMAAPKGTEDMTGSLGFGVGVAAGTQTLITTQDVVALKYWLTDVLAVSPSFNFSVTKPNVPNAPPGANDTRWNFDPSVVVLFVPFRSTSTRLLVGGGLGFHLGKTPPGTNTEVGIFLPITAGVEHFFTRWFSLGIAAQSRLIDYQKDIHFASTIDTTSFVGSLFFYTD